MGLGKAAKKNILHIGLIFNSSHNPKNLKLSRRSEEDDLIDLSTEFVVEEEHPAVDWGQFVTANTSTAVSTDQILPSSARNECGGSFPLTERIRMVLEALRNVLMMNPG